MKKILISSYDMEVGGVERSLISMLENIDNTRYKIDLMLFKHQGDFMNLLPQNSNLLPEVPQYSTFRKSIVETFRDKHYTIGFSRILSKVKTNLVNKTKRFEEPGYFQMQMMWKYALPFLPEIKDEYDVAISYLWPHDFIAEKVNAKKKLGWIHTDFSTIETDVKLDLKVWNKFDHIIAVSEECKNSFVRKYKDLEEKVIVIENITSPKFILEMSEGDVTNPMLFDTRFKLLTVARLSHAKGIDQAVEALKILIDKGIRDIVWYVVGYGGDEDFIKKLIAQNNLENNFILLGKRTNPYPFIRACDLYVQPSRYEGKAVTVTEAKIVGKPILITNYPTARSQVEHGIDGLICDLSIEGLSEGIEKMYNERDLRKELISNLNGMDFSNKHEINKLYDLIGQG
jgi:glycosyltransferase involved in cell wall biosynthesis